MSSKLSKIPNLKKTAARVANSCGDAKESCGIEGETLYSARFAKRVTKSRFPGTGFGVEGRSPSRSRRRRRRAPPGGVAPSTREKWGLLVGRRRRERRAHAWLAGPQVGPGREERKGLGGGRGSGLREEGEKG